MGCTYSGPISACYSTGSVSGTEDVGGLVGYKYGGSVSKSFWDTTTSGRTKSDGGTGLTTTQMQDIQTFLDAGWDFVNTWCMPAKDYPRLRWEGIPCDGVTVGQ